MFSFQNIIMLWENYWQIFIFEGLKYTIILSSDFYKFNAFTIEESFFFLIAITGGSAVSITSCA